MILEILTNCGNRGGSGTGVSHYMSGASCPRKCRLDKEVEKSDFGSEKTIRRDAGIIFHKLAELYHGQTGAEELKAVIEYDDAPSLNPALSEAQRMFIAYKKCRDRKHWGKVLGVEVPIPGEEATEETKARLKEVMGVEPFTALIDMVVEVQEENVAAICRRTGLDLTPGVYLFDHKTKGRMDSNMHIVHGQSLQAAAYQMGYEAMTGVKPNGMIFSIVVAHKVMAAKSFASFVADYPPEHVQEGVRGFLNGAKALAGSDFPNWSACFNRFGICQHLTSGACDRR